MIGRLKAIGIKKALELANCADDLQTKKLLELIGIRELIQKLERGKK